MKQISDYSENYTEEESVLGANPSAASKSQRPKQDIKYNFDPDSTGKTYSDIKDSELKSGDLSGMSRPQTLNEKPSLTKQPAGLLLDESKKGSDKKPV